MRVFLLICLFVLSGCEIETEKVIVVEEEELVLKNDVIDIFTVNGQEFKIHPWYGYYVEYLKEDFSSADARSDHFQKIVGNPLSNEVLGYDYGYQNNIYLKPPS